MHHFDDDDDDDDGGDDDDDDDEGDDDADGDDGKLNVQHRREEKQNGIRTKHKCLENTKKQTKHN